MVQNLNRCSAVIFMLLRKRKTIHLRYRLSFIRKQPGSTHFSFSISIDRRFISVSLKSKLRFSVLKLRSGRRAVGERAEAWKRETVIHKRYSKTVWTELSKDSEEKGSTYRIVLNVTAIRILTVQAHVWTQSRRTEKQVSTVHCLHCLISDNAYCHFWSEFTKLIAANRILPYTCISILLYMQELQ